MAHNPRIFIICFVFAIATLVLVACDRAAPREEKSVIPVPTWTPTDRAVAAPTPTLPATPVVVIATPTTRPAMAAESLLPAPLYFIDQTSGQIRRIERDGATLTPITQEQAPVLDFDVSPINGHLVYVSGNDLIACDALGSNRRVSVDGPDVPLINLQSEIVRYGPTLTVSAPRFSPDGQQLAFGLGGVKLMPVSGSTAPVTILVSDPYTLTSDAPNNGNYFLPYAWSPDGGRLLVEARNYWEGRAWGILEQPGHANGYVELPVCCDPVWSPQGDTIYLSNVQDAIRPPSLHRWVVATGELISMLEQIGVAFPHVNQEGVFLAFAASGRQSPITGIDLLALHRLDLTSGSAPLVRLSADDYAIWDVLWAGDDRGALIVERNDISGLAPFTGLLIWLPADGSPGVPLRALGSHPRWGLPPNAVVTPHVTTTPTLIASAGPGVIAKASGTLVLHDQTPTRLVLDQTYVY